MPFTIRRREDLTYMLLGTYQGDTEEDALDALAREEGHDDFKASCKYTGLKRDDYRLDEVDADGRNSDDRAYFNAHKRKKPQSG